MDGRGRRSLVEEAGTCADLDALTQHNVTYHLELLRERPWTLFPHFPWLERRDDGTYRPAEGAPLPAHVLAARPQARRVARRTGAPRCGQGSRGS